MFRDLGIKLGIIKDLTPDEIANKLRVESKGGQPLSAGDRRRMAADALRDTNASDTVIRSGGGSVAGEAIRALNRLASKQE